MGTAGATRHSMIKVCVLLLAGGMAAQHTTLLVRSDSTSLMLFASIAALFLRRARAMALLLAGFAVFQLAGERIIEQRIDERFAGDSMLTVVRVAEFPAVNGESVTMIVEPLSDHRLPPRSRVSWFEPPLVPRLGEVWELELRLRPPRGSANPGVFDYETWFFREGLHATGYVVGGKRNHRLHEGAMTSTQAFRKRFIARAHAATDSDSAAAVLVAIATGARHLISREQWERFAVSGTSHLVAISGLHVGLAAMVALGIAWVPGGLVLRRYGHFVPALFAGSVAAAAYAGVAGFGVPAQRAALMLAVAGIAVMRRRPPDPGAAVALAGVVVFVSNPVASLAPGFHLSFGAVVLLLWLARRKSCRTSRYLEVPRQLLVMQVFLMFGLLPVTAVIFNRFALVATPVNIVGVPLFSLVVVPFTLTGMVLGELREAYAAPFLAVAALGVGVLDAVVAFFADLPFAGDTLADIEGKAICLLLLPLVWVALPRGWPGRALAVLAALAIVLWRPPSPPADCFDAWVLDVGQGLAVVVQTRDGALLYDTGMAWRGGGSVAQYVIKPFLAARGIEAIDRLVVSHGDLDHSGGVAEVVSEFQPRFVISGEPLPATSTWRCAAGKSWWSGVVHFEFLHPPSGHREEGNEASCVLRVSVGRHRLLLTGDIEARGERLMLQSVARPGRGRGDRAASWEQDIVERALRQCRRRRAGHRVRCLREPLGLSQAGRGRALGGGRRHRSEHRAGGSSAHSHLCVRRPRQRGSGAAAAAPLLAC